jgi:hypothetical protein
VVPRAFIKTFNIARGQWLTPVILSTQKPEIRRIMVRSQPRQIVWRPYLKKTLHQNGWWSGLRFML